jgi:hypothetical protein
MEYELGYYINQIIQNSLSQPYKQYEGSNDILFSNFNYNILESAYKLKILQMRIGIIWEKIFCLFNYQKINYGADLVNHEKRVVMELKNSFNTDNASSRTQNIKKLIQCNNDYLNNEYLLVYGIINDKNSMGKYEVQYHHGYRILFLSGSYLFHFVFGNDFQNIVNYICACFNYYSYYY